MTLPEKSGKEYPKIKVIPRATIAGEPHHLTDLEGLLRRRGIPCTRLVSTGDREALELPLGTDLIVVQEVLDGYKAAKGS